MSSIPNRFNSYIDDSTSHHEQTNSNLRNHNSEVLRSMFITSDHINHRDLFSSSPSFTCYQNSNVSSSLFGFNNSHETYHVNRNIDFGFGAKYLPINDNPRFSQVSFTQTITNRYSAIVPTNTIPTVQNDIERVRRAMDSNPNIWNPSFHPPYFLDKYCETLNPKPLSVIFPNQDSAYRHHLDLFSLSPKNNHYQHLPSQHVPSMEIPKQPSFIEETTDYSDFEEKERSDQDDHYDGRTHSLPYQKYGPYTCLKCDGVFETSQKFASHMKLHYKNETTKERDQRYRARNKNKYRKLTHEIHGKSQNIKLEDGVSSSGASDNEAFENHVIV